MRVGHLRALIRLVLLLIVIVIGGWGLGPLPAPGQGQQLPCPEKGCPEQPKDAPPPGKQWVLVIVHVGAGPKGVACSADNSPVEGAKISFIDKAGKVLKPSSEQPAQGLTDAKGRYAAYFPFTEATWDEVKKNDVKEVQIEKKDFTLDKISYIEIRAVLATMPLLARACMIAKKPTLNLSIAAAPGEQVGDLAPANKPGGSWTCVNLDNDDRDGQFDLNQNNVNGEDDLVRLTVNPPTGGNPNNEVQLRVDKQAGGGNIKVWEDIKKTKLVNLPVKYPVKDLPKTLWIEGVQGSKGARDVKLVLEPAGIFKDDQGKDITKDVKSDTVALTVIAVEKMEWVGQNNSVTGGNNLDGNAHPGPNGTVGKRVFPDAPKAGQPARDRVTLQVTLSAPVPAKFELYLRALDVDDPSSNNAPLDPNDTAPAAGKYPDTNINYTLNEDNRGSVGGFKSGQFVRRAPDVEVPATALTDPQDVKYLPATLIFNPNAKFNQVDFQVTKQPGDNFRVLASCDPDFLNDAVNQDNQQHGLEIRIAPAKGAPLALLPEHKSWQSEVLTVWRWLHLEVDSMAAPPNRPQACPGGWVVNMNTVCGRITNVAPSPQANQSLVTTDQTLEDDNQYENGSLRLGPPPARQFKSLGNTAGPNATVTVQNDATGAPPNNQPFDLHDDDNDAILPNLPDLGWMQNNDNAAQNLFAWAYIRPINDGGGGNFNQQDLTFRANVLDGQEVAQANQGRNSTNTNDFWVSYVQAVFQGWIDADNDPNDEGALLGLCRGCLTSTQNGALIYLETIRDDTQISGINQLDIERGVVVHEIGHQFKARHPTTGEPDDDIMGWAWFTNQNNRRFNERNLNQIRSICRPGVVAAAGGVCP